MPALEQFHACARLLKLSELLSLTGLKSEPRGKACELKAPSTPMVERDTTRAEKREFDAQKLPRTPLAVLADGSVTYRFQTSRASHQKYDEVHGPVVMLSGTATTHSCTSWGNLPSPQQEKFS